MTVQFPILCRGILFDMDGTLIDTTAAVERHWKNWADAHNVDFDALIATSHGRPSFEVINQWAPAHLVEDYMKPEYLAQLEKNVADDLEGMRLIPGAKELLKYLPRTNWAVVTSAGLQMATQRFIQTGLATPPVLVTANHVTKGKPHPEGYISAAKQLNLDPKDCVVFEDAPAGIRAGVSAEAKAVFGMNTGTVSLEHIEEAGPSIVINSFEDLDIKVGPDGWIEINLKQK
ncbi:hypothetical protein BGZ76_004834 [Entomortierella beljakovae]|nr:hypothetical protein BGZ76_004834 [Entomortierella beljakovae]